MSKGVSQLVVGGCGGWSIMDGGLAPVGRVVGEGDRRHGRGSRDLTAGGFP